MRIFVNKESILRISTFLRILINTESILRKIKLNSLR